MGNNIYTQTLNTLFSLADKKYKTFSEKIANSQKQLIGVQIPKLRKITETILKNDYKNYLENCQFEYFEDTLIYGLIIAKLDYDEFISYLEIYLSHIDSWSHVDSFVSSIKSIPKRKSDFLGYLNKEISNANGFRLRFFLICLMEYYLDEDCLSFIFSICEKYDGKGYYNDMAIAWLVSVAFVKFKEQTFNFIKNCKLSDFTLNKSISKICDSFRVTKESKTLLKNFIRKK